MIKEECFDDWLTKCLKERHIKKKVFAEMMDTTPQTISRWCNGAVVPERNTILAIKYVLGIYTDEQKENILDCFTTKELLTEIERRCGK